MASGHLIVVERLADFRWADADARVVTAEDFISEHTGESADLSGRPAADAGKRPRKVINLCRNYDYLSLGYYCSLLAEARGDRVTPTVETILDLQHRSSQQASLARLDRLIAGLDEVPRSVNTLSFHVFFGHIEDPELADLARKAFELFRCPLLQIELERPDGLNGWKTAAVRALDPREVDASRDALFMGALEEFTRRRWTPALSQYVPKMDLAILHDPTDPLPPSSLATLQHIVEVGQSMDIAVELIRKKDFSRLTQFDALFIRETTAVAHHTFKFAKKAEAEGMPVIDDPGSILRCTNKAFLAELLREHDVATPRTRLVSRRSLPRFEDSLDYPVVLKVPDGSFSRDVRKAQDFKQFQEIADAMFKESEIVLVQDYMYTPYDWRVGVLGGEALFVARYHMVRDHWQIIKHAGDGPSTEGRTEAVALQDTPRAVLDTAVKAARLIGDGFYGVDLKQTDAGVFVIEINDNPNLDVGAEDKVLGDEVYRRLLGHLLAKFEQRGAAVPHEQPLPTGLPASSKLGNVIRLGSD
ncbi:RimK family protein [Paucibacter sp. JuS9]|uniref:RimK family protein n=1 Tax=Paucibacter sp. JuS9 TaxID=3228748 RepID=UPI0037571517